MATNGIEIRVNDRMLTQVIRKHPQNASRWLDMVAESMVGDIKESFGTSPPGRRYSRGRGRYHVASQPGYPPNVDYGALINSIHWERISPLTRHIQDGVEYGYELEEERNRPFMRPVFEDWTGKIGNHARQHLVIG